MIVDGQGDIALRDLGGVPVIWQDGVGVVQDPAYGANVYGPGGVFQDDQGQMYQLGSDYHIRPYGAVKTGGGSTNPATQPQASGATTDDVLTAIRKLAAPSQTVAPQPNRQTAADPNVRAATGTASTLGTFFGQNLQLGQGFRVPYWLLAAGGVALMARRRRHR
jgi:hypothetical protein